MNVLNAVEGVNPNEALNREQARIQALGCQLPRIFTCLLSVRGFFYFKKLIKLRRVDMKTHKFDVKDAVEHGVYKAILLEHLRYHQESNKGHEDLTFAGKPHAFIKKETIEEMFSYLKYNSVRKWLKELEDDGVIESHKPHAKSGYHLKYYHVLPNDLTDQSNDTTGQSKNDLTDHSSIVTYVELPNEKAEPSIYDQKIVDVIPRIEELSNEEDSDKDVLMALHIWNDVNNIRPNNKTTLKATVKNWSDPVRLMVEQDDRTYQEIFRLWKGIQADEFWRVNVLSTGKLREKFDDLAIKLLNRRKNGQFTDDEIDQVVDSMYE